MVFLVFFLYFSLAIFFLKRIDYYSYIPQLNYHMQPTVKRVPVRARTCTHAVHVLTVKALPAVCMVHTCMRIDW